jgi:tRNA threonylcarbamoyl adenosine modification protein YeaZ
VLLLALDTATPAVTVALHDGTSVLAEESRIDARRHGELLLPAVDRVLAAAGAALGDVTDLVVGVGPGPYTGLRVGLATAVAFGTALDVPVHGVCSLDGLAYASGLQEPFLVVTDARRKEVYWARYADARTRVTDPAVDHPGDVADARDTAGGLPVVGAGALLHPDAFPGARGPEHQSAAALASLGAGLLAAGGAGFLPPLPLYLRRPDAQVPKNYKVVTPK